MSRYNLPGHIFKDSNQLGLKMPQSRPSTSVFPAKSHYLGTARASFAQFLPELSDSISPK